MKARCAGFEIAAIDHILLRDAHQHVVEVDQLLGLLRLDLLEVVAEAGFRGAPVGHGVAPGFAGRSCPWSRTSRDPSTGVALDVERFLIGLAQARVEDELGHAARVADALRLVEGHVVGDAVLGLAGGEGLQEHGAAVLQAVENGAVELGRVGHGDLRDERRAVAGEEGLGDGLLLGVLALRGRAEDVHVVAAEHGRRVGVLAAGVGVDLRVEHERLDVGPVLQDHLGHVLVADVAHAAVAADHPDLGQLDDFLVGHQRIGEVGEVVVLRASLMPLPSR